MPIAYFSAKNQKIPKVVSIILTVHSSLTLQMPDFRVYIYMVTFCSSHAGIGLETRSGAGFVTVDYLLF